jgi:hypothetical protein
MRVENSTRVRLRHLFLIGAKRRLINNTPYDVYRLASLFPTEEVDVIDLRFDPPDPLPASDSVVLFLETAGTWMCFDWDPERFIGLLDALIANYPACTVVGPQAAALRELTGYAFTPVDRLDFRSAIAPEANSTGLALAPAWLGAERHRAYNGEHFDGRRMRLLPTFSISYSMNCPLRCSFCYYGEARRSARESFAATMRDIERIWAHGHRRFYFMDPNLLLSPSQFDALCDFHARTDEHFSYFCQVSPNYLSDVRLHRLVASGCHGMVIGIENAERIAAKGSIVEARDRVAQVQALGMMPMLFFMIDGRNDVETLVDVFDSVPFLYTVINHAFAGDRSLQSIQSGFAAKHRIISQNRDLMMRLQRHPSYLGALAAHAHKAGAVEGAD